jgi:plastocyanin
MFGTMSYGNYFAAAQKTSTNSTTAKTNATAATAAKNATSAATKAATNATTSAAKSATNATSAAAANKTKTASTGGGTTTIAAAPTDTFLGRGWIDSVVPTSAGNATSAANSTASSSSGAPHWLLGGTWAIIVINGQVLHLGAEWSMVKPDGTGAHTHMIANFTSSGGQPVSFSNGAATISGTANVYAGNAIKWSSVPITVDIKGHAIVFHVDNAKTQNHFEGSPIYGTVTAILSRNLQSLLPTGAPPAAGQQATNATTATTTTTTTTPSSNPTNATTAPSTNATSANATTPTTGASTSTGGGATVPVSIVSGASTKTTDAFSPDPANAKVGDTVVWTNNDSQPHTVVSGENAKPDGKFNSSPNFNPLITPGQTFKHTFTQAGTYPYFCQLHPNMIGKVIVS